MSTYLADGWYWWVERDQIGLAYSSDGVFTSPTEVKTLRIFGRGYCDDIASEPDSFDFNDEFEEAPLYHALMSYAITNNDTEKYMIFKREFAELVAEGKAKAAENRTSSMARGLVPGANGVAY